MPEVMNKYETIMVVDMKDNEEQIKAVVEKFTNIISSAGTIDSIDEWGKRRLAYLIDDKSEGYYVLVNFQAPATLIKELDRVYRITEDIMRFIIIKKEDKKMPVKKAE